jgi:four helix bundle protein
MAFEDLEVWKRSAALSAEIYLELKLLRDYGFKDQITRSGLSVPCNIAEGMERNYNKEKRQFLFIAKSSCAELRTQTWIGIKVGYITDKKGKQWIQETKVLSAMLTSLIGSISQKL